MYAENGRATTHQTSRVVNPWLESFRGEGAQIVAAFVETARWAVVSEGCDVPMQRH